MAESQSSLLYAQLPEGGGLPGGSATYAAILTAEEELGQEMDQSSSLTGKAIATVGS